MLGSVAEEEASLRFIGVGVLQDGEIVLSKVGVEEEELTEAGTDAEVPLPKGFLEADRVVIGGACLLWCTLSSVRRGLEASGTGTCAKIGLEPKELVRWCGDVADGVLIDLGLDLEWGHVVIFGVAGVAVVELKAEVGLGNVAHGNESAGCVRAVLGDGGAVVGGLIRDDGSGDGRVVDAYTRDTEIELVDLADERRLGRGGLGTDWGRRYPKGAGEDDSGEERRSYADEGVADQVVRAPGARQRSIVSLNLC